MDHVNYVDDKIIKAVHDNGFFEDVWYDNGWIATIRHNKFSDLEYFIYFNTENQNYSFIKNLIHEIDTTEINIIMQSIARHYNEESFSLQKMSAIQNMLEIDISNLRKSLEEIKQWMDGETDIREVSYSLLLSIFVNDKLCNFSDLEESEQERIKIEIHKWLENCESIDSYCNEFVNKG